MRKLKKDYNDFLNEYKVNGIIKRNNTWSNE